jgi:DegV family protein with EDD domain
MSKIAIVTDSGTYLPEDLIHKYNIHIVPFKLIWGEHTYRDIEDITPEEFYTRLETSKELPTTSQPSPADFQEVYHQLLQDGSEILGIHVSAKLSGTLESAIQAQASFPGAPIELVDSQTTSMEMGFHLLTVAKAAASGASLQECKILAEMVRSFSGIYFVVETLEYLRRGGRIGGATAFLGNALDLKPILTIRDGEVMPVARVRTKKKAIDRMLEIAGERIQSKQPLHLCAVHVNAPDKAHEMLTLARKKFRHLHIVDSMVTGVSPVIGTHVGPGTIGLAFLAGM